MPNSPFLSEGILSHQQRITQQPITALFEANPNRFAEFSTRCGELLLDYSKNHIDEAALAELIGLAEQCRLTDKINAMFSGQPINNTEQRAVLHTALRNGGYHLDADTADNINQTRERMLLLADKLQATELLGCTGKPIDTVVNIGVGGSDLGPAMAVDALKKYYAGHTRFLFVSNIDPVHISRTLEHCNPETTLFVVCSKTFTTLETLANANAARHWFLEKTGRHDAIKHHFLAVSTNLEAAAEFGIPQENIFPMWDWVGGRYSLWSAIGLSIALAIGRDHFESFLAGARAMDEHFNSMPLRQNMPVILALLGIWHTDYFAAQSQALICYDQNLALFPAYLQQLDMESNGKSVTRDGDTVDYPTGAILWGGVGTNTQHSFHQLLHQGTHFIPIDFIVGVQSTDPVADQQTSLYSNCLAQSQALMMGRTLADLEAEMLAQGKTAAEARFLAKHRFVPGNRPSNTLVYPLLTPYVLGQLIALYEHKIFTQSVVWDINAFDQWGVELGKQLSKKITASLKEPGKAATEDGSTKGLIDYFQKYR
ncbi:MULTISPECIES: glucose-6-phosphate isomerase [unclassified Ketobacter]|uniref:glucose-6-phosphate isomerase n=1 Tax=unclassified Ketobacter TaxID=2639109 RepID=UPI000F272745|nr:MULTISPECIES: glucose-6-phosphate isomerase [unclassified Ketobacter]RLT90108.1 MAG: glucose-6-phosphate isomerase [Ketobacter sp. GenoA1]RLT99119.1 MAG: glucose-6-phosphate isomerase [Ketobacter sp.]